MILLRRLFAPLLAVCLGLAAAGAASAAPITYEAATFKLKDGTELPVERGTMMVPENRHDPKSRKIPVRFIRFKSTAARPGRPIVYLAGGPGGSGVATARGPRQPVFLALRAVADVIALDQRGTGLSNSIPPCTAARAFDITQPLTEASYAAYQRGVIEGCLPFWKAAGVDILGYTTVESADDLEDLRQGLGVRQIDLWGISYGTHLALAAMKRHPGSIGRVALASVEGLNQTVKSPAHLDMALARIAAASGDPGLFARMRRVHERFDREMPTVTLSGPGAAAPVSFRMDAFALRGLAGAIPKNPDGIPRLAALYQGLDQPDLGPALSGVGNVIYGNYLMQPSTLGGMGDAMDIASGITPSRLAQVQAEARAGALLGLATNFPMPQLSGVIPGIDLGDNFRRELKSSIPTLVISGDLDIRTPLEEQAEATAGLSRKHVIIVKNGGHDLYEAHPQMGAILSAFFRGEPVKVRELVLPLPSR